MKCVSSGTFPKLRTLFPSFESLGKVINKSRVTVWRKLNETGFTENEQVLILNHLGIEDSSENRQNIFRR